MDLIKAGQCRIVEIKKHTNIACKLMFVSKCSVNGGAET